MKIKVSIQIVLIQLRACLYRQYLIRSRASWRRSILPFFLSPLMLAYCLNLVATWWTTMTTLLSRDAMSLPAQFGSIDISVGGGGHESSGTSPPVTMIRWAVIPSQGNHVQWGPREHQPPTKESHLEDLIDRIRRHYHPPPVSSESFTMTTTRDGFGQQTHGNPAAVDHQVFPVQMLRRDGDHDARMNVPSWPNFQFYSYRESFYRFSIMSLPYRRRYSWTNPTCTETQIILNLLGNRSLPLAQFHDVILFTTKPDEEKRLPTLSSSSSSSWDFRETKNRSMSHETLTRYWFLGSHHQDRIPGNLKTYVIYFSYSWMLGELLLTILQERGLSNSRSLLHLMGLSQSSYYMTWFLGSAMISLFASLNLLCFVRFFRSDLMDLQVPFATSYLMIWTTMMMLFCISSLNQSYQLRRNLGIGILVSTPLVERLIRDYWNSLDPSSPRSMPRLVISLLGEGYLMMMPFFHFKRFIEASGEFGLLNGFLSGNFLNVSNLQNEFDTTRHRLIYRRRLSSIGSPWLFDSTASSNRFSRDLCGFSSCFLGILGLYTILAWYLDQKCHERFNPFLSSSSEKFLQISTTTSSIEDHLRVLPTSSDRFDDHAKSDPHQVRMMGSSSDQVSTDSLKDSGPDASSCLMRYINLTKIHSYPRSLVQWTRRGELVKKMKPLPLVDKVNLILKENQVLALLGQNTVEKKYLLSLISGRIMPDSGDVFIHDQLVKEYRHLRGYISVATPTNLDILSPKLTGREHLEFFNALKLTNLCVIHDETKSQEITITNPREKLIYLNSLIDSQLESMKLLNVADEPVSSYSYDMRRRLSMILYSLGYPKMIIIDEPTHQVDSMSRRLIWKYIQDLKSNKCTILLSTSDIEEFNLLADQLAIMTKGQLEYFGPVSSLKYQFRSDYKLSLTTELKDRCTVMDLTQKHLPEARLVETPMESLLVFHISSKSILQVTQFLRSYAHRGPSRLSTPKTTSRGAYRGEDAHPSSSSRFPSPETSFSEDVLPSYLRQRHQQQQQHHLDPHSESFSCSYRHQQAIPLIRDWSLSPCTFEEVLQEKMNKH